MEMQWAAYVQRLRGGGALSSAMAVCDVSGSMGGQPMEVSHALMRIERNHILPLGVHCSISTTAGPLSSAVVVWGVPGSKEGSPCM